MKNDAQAIQPKRWTVKVKGEDRRRERQLAEGAIITNEKAKARFWKRVVKSDGCWTYSGTLDQCGYGMFGLKAFTMYRAHRIGWILANEKVIPLGMKVCHHCDNPPCVRPDHLFIGTDHDNAMDCSKKGRWGPPRTFGEAHGKAKLNDNMVRAIRLDSRTNKEIAATYQISDTAVRQVKSFKRWKHVV